MTSFDLHKFCSIVQEHKITYTYVAPPVVLHLAKSPVVEKYNLSSLKMITSGAAPLSKELIFAVYERLGTEVKQAYGLSESSPVTHMQVCLPPPPQSPPLLKLLETEKMERRPRLQRSTSPKPNREIHVS
jgi:acyl-coenzyme A synthetase/AMP-(fatty) acid ligase